MTFYSQPSSRRFYKNDLNGYAFMMSTLYIENPRELCKAGSLCLVDLALFCGETTPGRVACYFSSVAIHLLDLHFPGYMECFCKT